MRIFAIALSLPLFILACIYVWMLISIYRNGKKENNLFSDELDELAQDL